MNSNTSSSFSLEQLYDKLFRLSNLYQIIDQYGKLVTFTPNKAQLHFHQHKALRNIILKSRRLGMTTFNAIDMLDNTLFTPNFNALFLSYDDDSSKDVFDNLIDFNWKKLPLFLKNKYKVDTSTAKQLKLDFGNHIFSTIQVKSSGRGAGLNQIHISELGYIAQKYPDKATEIISGTIPALSPTGFLTIESTAKGEDNLFHTMFMEAYQNPQAYQKYTEALKPFFFNWQWDQRINLIKAPETNLPKDFLDYQKKHNENATKNPATLTPITDIQLTFFYRKFIEHKKDWSLLLENYPTTPEEAFITSGQKIFSKELVDLQRQFVRAPLRYDGGWQFFEEPNLRHNYIMGVDPSEGVGRDHSAITILDTSTHKKRVVATFTSNFTDTDMLAYEISHKGKQYNNAFVIVERNNTGHGVLATLKNIYPTDLIYKEHNQLYEETKQTDRLGFVSNAGSKKLMYSRLKESLSELHLLIISNPLLLEVQSYGTNHLNTNKTTEKTTNHFDLLTSLALANYATEFAEFTDDMVITYQAQNQENFDPFAPV